MRNTVILGAGLAGMSTAYYLGNDYELFEKKAHSGGLCITHEKDGFHFDMTGHWLHMRDPDIRSMVHKIMTAPMVKVFRDSRIFSKGVYTHYPFQSNTYGLPSEVIKEVISGFIESRYINPIVDEPRNFEQWVLKYMGKGIAKHFMIPYNEKLWCTHPREMSTLWCQHYIPKPELDQILDGALKAPDENIGYNASFTYPKKGGIGAISKALCASLDSGRIHYRTAPKRIQAKTRRMELPGGQTVGYRHLVSTIPLPELIKLIDDAPLSVRRAADNLVCNQVYYFNIAVDNKIPIPAHWVYLPEKQFVYYRAGCFSNAVKSMAPKGKSSLYVEVSHRGTHPPKGRLYQRVLKGLIESRIIKNADEVLFHEARNIPYAYVVFDHNYERSLKAIMPWLRRYGIHTIGRYGRWTYNSMESALIDGRETAAEIKEAG